MGSQMTTTNTTQPTTNPKAQRSVRASAADVSNPARETAAANSRLLELKVTAHTTALTRLQPASDLRFYPQPLMPNQEAGSDGVDA